MPALFAIGSNGSGQLGIGHLEDVSVPKPLRFHPEPPSSPVVRVCAGGNHTLLLTKAGEIWWSGDSKPGCCGRGESLSEPAFQKVEGVQGEVTLIAATWEASCFVTQEGAFTMGLGNKGELGLGELMIRTPRPEKIPDFLPPDSNLVDLSACMGYVVAVLDNGEVYGWGNCRKGQIGEPAGIVHSPRKIDVDFKVTRAVCCKEATVLFGEPSSDKMRVLGSDKWSLLSAAPTGMLGWKDVGASWGSVYVLKQDGSLVAWGRDDHGQLPPPNLPNLKAIAIGSEHVVALSQEGDVLAWGWGEHGNCGPSAENDIKGRWNVIASSKFIPKGASINLVGAGCATSFVGITSG